MALSLESISRATAVKAPRILHYGVPGIGKTTWASGAPSPVFILAEDGLGMLQVPHFPLAKSYSDVVEAMRVLYEEDHEFQTVVIDTVDALEPLIWRHVCERDKKKSIEDFGYGKGYTHAAEEWLGFIDYLDLLRDRGLAVVLLAHSAVVRFDAPDVPSYDTYTIKLNKHAAPILIEKCDAVLFSNYRVEMVVKEDGGFNKAKGKGKGQGERVTYTTQRPAWTAKNRYSLPDQLPMSWAAFQEALAGRLPAAPQEETAQDGPASNGEAAAPATTATATRTRKAKA